MAGTKLGGQRAAETNIRKYGEDFYRNIGKIGGKFRGLKGFALNKELASRAGTIGGRNSRRG